MRLGTMATMLAGAVLLLPFTARAADGTFDRTLKVSGPVLIGLDTGSGNVHVLAGPVTTVQIIGHVHSSHGWMGGGSPEQSVQRVLAHPPITQAGNIISIGHNFHEDNVSIDYDVTTPRGTDLRVDTGSGNIVVEGTGGPTQLKSGSGNIHGSGLSDHVSIETGSGDITADLLSARDVQAQTGNGNITLNNVQGGLWAHTGSGNIEVNGRPIAAAWKVETGSGDVSLNTGGAPLDLNATTGSGYIRYTGGTLRQNNTPSPNHVMGDANGGGPTVRVTTGSGNIHVQ